MIFTMTSRRAFLALAGAALNASAKSGLSGPLGVQLYSFRREAEKDLPETLAAIRKMGFSEMEAGQFYGHTPADFRRIAAEHGLRVTSMGAEWDQLSKSATEAAENARTLGAGYVVCSSIPRKKGLTLEDVERAAENFNRWGQTLAGAGLRFCYHPHGPEFVNGPDGTLFDTLAKRMDAKLANFEMDVFWVHLGSQDPVALLERYPGRFLLMHLKDVRKGERKTFDPGPVEEEASVPLGTGEIDWPRVLRAAAKAGVRRYYVEEEHPAAMQQVPQTLRYLKALRF